MKEVSIDDNNWYADSIVDSIVKVIQITGMKFNNFDGKLIL